MTDDDDDDVRAISIDDAHHGASVIWFRRMNNSVRTMFVYILYPWTNLASASANTYLVNKIIA